MMTRTTARTIGNGFLIIGIVLLLITVSGMAGWTRKLAPSGELILVCMVLIILARGFRRRASRAEA